MKLNIAMVTKNLTLNGITTVIDMYASNLDSDRFKVTIICEEPVNPTIKNKFEHNNIDVLQCKQTSPIRYLAEINRLVKNNDYNIIHIHGQNAALITAILCLPKVYKIPVKVVHSHNTTCNMKSLHKLFRNILNGLTDRRLACSKEAGYWMFKTKPFDILPNAFNLNKFLFSKQTRCMLRQKLGYTENDIIIGTIGRINVQKNQVFLVSLFEKLNNICPESKLLIVGDGPDLPKLKAQVTKSAVSDKITIYGSTATPEQFYSAFDLFILPSKYEGFPVTLLEAQINGVPIIISDIITDKVIINSNIKKISLNDNLETSASICMSLINKRITPDIHKFKEYDITEAVHILENIYLDERRE